MLAHNLQVENNTTGSLNDTPSKRCRLTCGVCWGHPCRQRKRINAEPLSRGSNLLPRPAPSQLAPPAGGDGEAVLTNSTSGSSLPLVEFMNPQHLQHLVVQWLLRVALRVPVGRRTVGTLAGTLV